MKFNSCLRIDVAMAMTSLLCASGSALAQGTQVQVYGILDAGVQVEKSGEAGSGWVKKVTSGNQWASRLGFKGSEDLGGGLQALFNIESGIAIDTGEVITYGTGPNGLWARRSVVGLKGSFGEVFLGRDYTPGFWSVIQLDRNLYGLPGTVSTASQIRDARADNGVFYNTPNIAGFIGRFGVAAGEGVTGRLVAASVDYRLGGLFASASFQRRNALASATAPAGHNDEGGLGAEYKFGRYAVNAAYWATDPVAAAAGSVDKTKAYWVGASATFGPHVIYAQVARTRFDYVGAPSGSAVNYGVSYNYFLSKRTNLYASYGGVNNDANTRMALSTGSVRVGGLAMGADPKAVVVGIKHSF